MARLPQDTDYGARQSLRVNRVDRPDTSGVVLAETLVNAANNFSTVLKERKAKEDAVNYSLARNRIQQADLETRAEFEGDKDWATYDDRYSDMLTKRSEEILGDYNFGAHDLAIIGSEIGLIKARGRVAMGGVARGMEVTAAKGSYLEGRSLALKSLEQAQDGPTRNGIILGQLDAINAQLEAGYMDEVEAQKEREGMTQEFAERSISAMSPEEQVRVLSASLRYRKGYSTDFGKYSEDINKASQKYGIPGELIAAQIQKESSGNPNAKSGAFGDPTGLMQLGEDAAADMGVTDRTNPSQSIDGGTKYLAHQLKLFDGDKAIIGVERRFFRPMTILVMTG
jgi:hypothetical protein